MKKMFLFSVITLGILNSSVSYAKESRKPNQIGDVGTHGFAADFFNAKTVSNASEKLEIYSALLSGANEKINSSDVASMAEALSVIFSGSKVQIMRDVKSNLCRVSSTTNHEGHILQFECKKDSRGILKAAKFSYVEAG